MTSLSLYFCWVAPRPMKSQVVPGVPSRMVSGTLPLTIRASALTSNMVDLLDILGPLRPLIPQWAAATRSQCLETSQHGDSQPTMMFVNANAFFWLWKIPRNLRTYHDFTPKKQHLHEDSAKCWSGKLLGSASASFGHTFPAAMPRWMVKVVVFYRFFNTRPLD